MNVSGDRGWLLVAGWELVTVLDGWLGLRLILVDVGRAWFGGWGLVAAVGVAHLLLVVEWDILLRRIMLLLLLLLLLAWGRRAGSESVKWRGKLEHARAHRHGRFVILRERMLRRRRTRVWGRVCLGWRERERLLVRTTAARTAA